MSPKYASRKDGNHHELISLARHLGAYVRILGPLDMWVWCKRKKVWMPVEIKDPKKEGWASEYTPAQKVFFGDCGIHDAPWWVWRTEADVMRDLGVKQMWEAIGVVGSEAPL